MYQDLLVLTLHLGPMGFLGHAKIIVDSICVTMEPQPHRIWDLHLTTPKETAVSAERVRNWAKNAWIRIQKNYASGSKMLVDVMWIRIRICIRPDILHAKRPVVVYANYLIIHVPIPIFVATRVVNLLNEF